MRVQGKKSVKCTTFYSSGSTKRLRINKVEVHKRKKKKTGGSCQGSRNNIFFSYSPWHELYMRNQTITSQRKPLESHNEYGFAQTTEIELKSTA